jgi:hypothetical protein
MGQLSGSKPCEGGCGRQISATRRWCLRCVAGIVKENLERRGAPATQEEVMRALLEQT